MLNISNISKSYNARYLFSGVSFTVSTGKTTLFDIIAGSTSPDTGSASAGQSRVS